MSSNAESQKEDRIVKVCIKLDELRFNNTNHWGNLGFNIQKNENLRPSTRIFLLWLCSIIDQFYPTEQVWTEGEKAMLSLLKIRPKSFEDVKKVMNIRDIKGNVLADIPINNKSFKLVRDDYLRIKNTFDFLSSYGSDEEIDVKFVKLLGEFICSFKGKNGVLKIAYYLNAYLWENIRIDTPSEVELENFRNKPRKRLWMFLMILRRDPSIHKIFKKALIEVYGEDKGNELFSVWIDNERFDPKEIELPGDMWNSRVIEAITNTKNPKKWARERASIYGISPTVFDVTFEIGANMCRKNECDDCPFGENKLCHKGREKYCSLAERLFYERGEKICDPENCPIGKDLGKGLCDRKIDMMIGH